MSFKVAANADPVARTGGITVGDQQVGITQEAAPCVFTVNPRNDTAAAAGGRRTIAVSASSPQCAWTARSDVDWLAIVEGAQGTGTGQVTYEVRATTGPTRSGTLLVAGQVVTVTQGQGCTISLTPGSQNVPASGGTGTIAVATEAGCSWSVRSNVPWIAMTSGQTGSGPGTIGFSVSASDGPARSGTLSVEGQVFTVAQASGCRYTVSPASQSIPAAGGSGAVDVRSAAGCEWQARSDVPWLTIGSGGSGTGDGRVQFTVQASSGPARSGTLTVAGHSIAVNQASGCTHTLVPASQDVGDGAGAGSFTVRTSSGCGWTASSGAPWIRITSATSGAGDGVVSFNYDFNPMGLPARSGTITVDNQTFTLNQAAGVPCVFFLVPTSQNFSAAAGSGSFAVDTVGTCPWTAYSNDSWITIVGHPSGAGGGTVHFNVAANPPGSPARVGTISVRGPVFTITQAAATGQTTGALSTSPVEAAGPGNPIVPASHEANGSGPVPLKYSCEDPRE